MGSKNRGFGDRYPFRMPRVVFEAPAGREDLPSMKPRRRPYLLKAQPCSVCGVVMPKGSRLVKWDEGGGGWRHAACPLHAGITPA